MTRQDAERAVHSRRNNHVDVVFGENHALAGNDFDLQFSHDVSSDLSEAPELTFSACCSSFLALLTLGNGHVDTADIHERLLGQAIVLAFKDLFEAADGIFAGHELTRRAGELLGGKEWLREEAFDAASTVDGLLVLFAQPRYREWR